METASKTFNLTEFHHFMTIYQLNTNTFYSMLFRQLAIKSFDLSNSIYGCSNMTVFKVGKIETSLRIVSNSILTLKKFLHLNPTIL